MQTLLSEFSGGSTIVAELYDPTKGSVTGVELESDQFLPGSEGHHLVIPEGGSATFGVRLSRAPDANVTVNLGKLVAQQFHGKWDAVTVSPTTLTFTPTNYNTLQTVTVTGASVGDGGHEHVIVTAQIAGGKYLANGVYVTVTDDGGAAQIGIQPAAGREAGNGQASNVPVTVWLSRAASGTVSVSYRTADGTATAGSDYTAVNGTLTFAPGETRKTVNVPILDDNVEDSGETFFVELSNPSGASLMPGYTKGAPVEILNDEAHLDGLSVEGAPGAGGPWAKLDLGAFAAETTAYAVTVPHGTTHARLVPATADEDLTVRAGAGTELTRVRSGQSGPAVALAVGANVLVVKTTAGTGVEKAYEVTVTRQAAPAAVAVSLSAAPNPVVEGSPVTVTATLAKALDEAVTIPLTVTRGTSEDGDHGSLASIELPAGFTSATGTVSTTDDDDGDDETFTVALGSLTSGLTAGSTSSVRVTITDSALTARLRPAIAEHDGETPFMVELVLSNSLGWGSRWPTAASFDVKGGSVESVRAFRSAPDRFHVYVRPNSRKAVAVTLSGGRACDAAGAVCTADGRALSNSPTAAVAGPDGALSSDADLSALSAEGAPSAEGSWSVLGIGTFASATTSYSATVPHGTTHARLTATAADLGATLKAGAGSSLTAVTGGTASGAIALSVGANALKLEVTAEDGTVKTYAVTVTRQEAPVAVSLSAAPNPVVEGSPVTVTATLAKALEKAVTIPLTVTRGTSEDGDHGSLASITLPAGFTSVDGTISTADDADGDDETFTVALGSLPSGLVAGTASSVEVTITDSGLQRTAPLTLSGLSGSTSTDGSDFGGTLDIGTFAPGTTEYAATVGNAVTHVKLTATAGEPGATLKVGKGSSLAAVADGSASGAIPLSMGANALKVEVTAEDGTVTTYTVAVTRQAAPLTAAFGNVPSEHDGTAFTFDLTLSDAPGTGSLPVAASFKVAPGKASVSGSGTRYAVTVTPKAANAWKDVTITLNGGRACGEDGAICTADGRALSNTLSVTVSGPVRIRVAGARAKEGKDATLDFAVTLNRAVSHEVSVDYATKDETATAGLDYTATSGTLVFAAGVTERTVSVPVLDDSVDEGKEIMRLKLSNPKGAYLRGVHAKARGIITNNDPLPGAWLSRFGRTVAGHHVAAIRDRLAADRSPGLSARFAGQPLPTQMRDGAAQAADADGMKNASPETRVARDAQAAGAVLSSRTASGDADAFGETDGDETLAFRSLQAFLAGDGDEGEASVQAVAADDVLLGTDFVMTRDAGHGLSHGFWGRASRSGFSGREGETSVEGSVTGVLLGTDWKRKGMAFGVIVSESRGAMTYGGASSGAIDARLSALVPWAGLEIGEHSSLWGAAGIGRGDMTLRPDGQDPTVTGIGWSMAALGAEGALAPGARLGGASLGWHADALATRAESDAARTDTGNLAAGSGATTRMRLGLRAAWQRTLASGATLAPRLEAGVRHDGGDAETGIGLEVGGGIAFADLARGLSMSVDARTLALHEDGNFRDWGLSLGLSWDPRPETKRGCSATAMHGLGGASAGGVDALFGPEAFPGAPGVQGGSGWSVEAACGTGRGRGMVGSPWARASGGGEAESLRVGYRIEPDADHAEDATVQAWADPSADGGSVGAGLEWRW